MGRRGRRSGFLLAAVGAAVGLGNLWRFPSVAVQHGGGAYLLAYVVAVALIGIPLLILELVVGREGRGDVVSAFQGVRPSMVPLGWFVVATVTVALSYYLVLTGWVLAFFVSVLRGPVQDLQAFTAGPRSVVYFVGATLLTGGVVSLGLRDGVERFARAAMPVLAVLLGGLAVYAATLPAFAEAATALVAPDPGALTDPFLWIAAIGSAVVSLAVGHGVMLTLGRSLDGDVALPLSAAAIAAADVAFALVAGLAVLPVLAAAGGEPVTGTEMVFVTLPAAFTSVPHGQLLAVGFFGALAIAAITSAVALLEVGVAAVEHSSGIARRRATMGVAGAVVLLGLPAALSQGALDLGIQGLPVLVLMDETVGSLGLVVTALVIAVVFVWLPDRKGVVDRLPDTLHPVLRYVVPGALGMVVAGHVAGSTPVDVLGFRGATDAVDPRLRIILAAALFLGLLATGVLLMHALGPERRSEG